MIYGRKKDVNYSNWQSLGLICWVRIRIETEYRHFRFFITELSQSGFLVNTFFARFMIILQPYFVFMAVHGICFKNFVAWIRW